MDKAGKYIVEITPEAEHYYFKLLKYLYKTHSAEKAYKKSSEIIQLAQSLDNHPERGRKEEELAFIGKEHRFLVYRVTNRKTIKIIYFIDKMEMVVYITDFFPTQMKPTGLSKRNG